MDSEFNFDFDYASDSDFKFDLGLDFNLIFDLNSDLHPDLDLNLGSVSHLAQMLVVVCIHCVHEPEHACTLFCVCVCPFRIATQLCMPYTMWACIPCISVRVPSGY